MSRYINIDDLPTGRVEWDDIFDAPSIDIVFCEDCRDCVEKGVGTDCPSGYGYLYCTRKKSVVCEDDYCSWGSRK